MEKTVEIKVWQVGLFNRTCQVLILVYVFLSIFYMDKWAYSEVPLGSANAWPEGGETRVFDPVSRLADAAQGSARARPRSWRSKLTQLVRRTRALPLVSNTITALRNATLAAAAAARIVDRSS